MKLRNKLILSCAALAAVATTAVSTTYAWYTANTEVHATGITTTTKNAGSDLLMIADGVDNATTGALKTDTDLVWGTTVAPTLKTSELTPLAFTRANTSTVSTTQGYLADLTTSNNEMVTNTSASADATSGFLYFSLMIKNGGSDEKGLQMTIKNLTNTSTLPAKTILNPAQNAKFMGLGTTATSYKVDALRVAALDLEVYNVTDGAISSAALADEGCYYLASAIAATPSFSNTETVNTAGTNYSAHGYYNAIMETPLDLDDALNVNSASFRSLGASDGTKLLINVPAANAANNYLRLDFKVFLNGWDISCFDGCQAQAFSFAIDFETTTPNA